MRSNALTVEVGFKKETKISLERLEKLSRNFWWYEKWENLGCIVKCLLVIFKISGSVGWCFELCKVGFQTISSCQRGEMMFQRMLWAQLWFADFYSRGQGFAKRKISSTLNWRLWVDLTFRFPFIKEHGNLLNLWCSIGNASSFMVHFPQQCLVCLVTRV